MKKTLLSAAIVAACCSNVALAVTDDNELETRQALEAASGVPISAVTGLVEAPLLGGMRENDPSGGIFFEGFSGGDSTIAGVITTVSGLGGDGGGQEPPAAPDVEAVAGKLQEGDVPGAIAALTGSDDGSGDEDPDSVASSAEAGVVAVTVSGNVQQDLSCAIINSDTEFAFGDIDLADASVTSDAVSFSVTCNNETTATTIYLTTGETDPTVLGNGSNALVAEFNDGVSAASDVNLAVLLDSDSDGAGDVAIGSETGDVISAGDQTATAINLVATLDTTQITSGSGGTLTQKGTPEIAVWVN